MLPKAALSPPVPPSVVAATFMIQNPNVAAGTLAAQTSDSDAARELLLLNNQPR